MIYELDPARTALLVIDVQREYFDEGRPLAIPGADQVLPAIKNLVEAARQSGATPVFIRHAHNPDGSDVGRMGDFDDSEDEDAFIEGTTWVDYVDGIGPAPGELEVTKTRYSAFAGTALQVELESRGIDTVLITGLMTQYCSVTTARHAHDLDFRTLFVSDANFGPDLPDLGFGEVAHAETLKAIATALAGGVAEVISAEEAIGRLSG